jgi:hypothetical protein
MLGRQIYLSYTCEHLSSDPGVGRRRSASEPAAIPILRSNWWMAFGIIGASPCRNVPFRR